MSIDQILNFLGLAMRAGKVKQVNQSLLMKLKRKFEARYCCK